jgi:hypothetical protein
MLRVNEKLVESEKLSSYKNVEIQIKKNNME